LRDAAASGETGLLGKLVVAAIELYLGLPAPGFATKEGLAQTLTGEFRIDYEPLLARDSWLGEWLVSLAEALRELDETDLRALARFLPEGARRKALARELLLLGASPRSPVEPVLADVLDGLWVGVLPETVADALAKMSRIATVRPGKVHKDRQVRQASGESRTSTPKNERGGTP
jgi:hypothetical protein